MGDARGVSPGVHQHREATGGGGAWHHEGQRLAVL